MSDNTDELLIAALRHLGHAVWIYTNNTKQNAINPTQNEGSEFINNTFAMRSFDWSDTDEYLPNFKYKDFEVEWYKYLGRGMHINESITPEQINVMLNNCLESLNQEKS